MVRFGVPGMHIDTLSYADQRLNVVPVVQAPRRPETTDKKFPLWCEWRTNKNVQLPATEGEFWKLIRFESNGDATWVRYFSSGVSAGVSDLRDQVNTQVTPDGSGFIDIDGFIVANGSNPSGIPFETVADVGANTLDLNMQIATAIPANPGDSNSVGVCCFDSAAFTIDAATGYVQLLGGGTPPALQFDIDLANPPGTDPTVPDGTGMVGIFGTIVDNHLIPIQTHATVANAFDIELQVAAAITGAPGDKLDAGMCSFDDTAFAVDTDGYVQLIGGGAAIEEIDVDNGANVTPVAGVVSIKAEAVPQQSIPIRTNNDGVNAVLIEAQIATTAAPTPVDSSNCGVCCFDNTMFTIDATSGLVSIIGGIDGLNSITVDSISGTGVNPVVPSGAGIITVSGGQVATGTVGANVIRTNSDAPNTFDIEIQRSTTSASADSTLNGVSHYNTADFTVDSNAFVSLKTAYNPDYTNLGIGYVAPTFTVFSADGSALSASNPAYVRLGSNLNPGRVITYALTSNFTFSDSGGANNLGGNTFGTTAGVAWSVVMPWYIYAVSKSDDTAATIMISRIPNFGYSPPAAQISKTGSAVSTTQFSAFALDSTITVANYASTTVLLLGYFEMTKTAGNAWTVSALTPRQGIGVFNEAKKYGFPTDQNGAVRSCLSSTVGANTVPTFNQLGAAYQILIDGTIHFWYSFDFPTIAGVGGGQVKLHLPLDHNNNTPTDGGIYAGWDYIDAGLGTHFNGVFDVDGTSFTANRNYFYWVPSGSGTSRKLITGFNTANRLGTHKTYMIGTDPPN